MVVAGRSTATMTLDLDFGVTENFHSHPSSASSRCSSQDASSCGGGDKNLLDQGLQENGLRDHGLQDHGLQDHGWQSSQSSGMPVGIPPGQHRNHSCSHTSHDCSLSGNCAKIDCNYDSRWCSTAGSSAANEDSVLRLPSLANNGLDSKQGGLIGQEEDSDGSGGARPVELMCSPPNGSSCQHGNCPDTSEGLSKGHCSLGHCSLGYYSLGHSREKQSGHQGQDYVGEGCKRKKVNSCSGLSSKSSKGRCTKGKCKRQADDQSSKLPADKSQMDTQIDTQTDTKKKKSSGLKGHFTPWMFGWWKKGSEGPRDELSADSGISGGSVQNGHQGEWGDAKKVKSRGNVCKSKQHNDQPDVSSALLEESLSLPVSTAAQETQGPSGVKKTKYELISECITPPPNCESVQVKCATDVADRVDNLSALVGSINGAVGPPVFGDSPPEDHEVAVSSRVVQSPPYTVFLPPSSMYLDCPGKECMSSGSHMSAGTCASDMPLLSPKDISGSDNKQRSPFLLNRSRGHRRSFSMELSSIPRPGQLYHPHSCCNGECCKTSQDTLSSKKSGNSRHFEDVERPAEVNVQMQCCFEEMNNDQSHQETGRRPAHVFSLKHLCSDRTHDPEPQGMPPDYVKIAVILLLPALPCALPALIWALKARRSCRLGEYATAWQNSHRAFFCCFAALAGFAMLLLAVMVLTYTQNSNSRCDVATQHMSPQVFVPQTPAALPPMGNATMVPSHSGINEVRNLENGHVGQKEKEDLKDSSEKSREVNHSGSSTIAPTETLMQLFKGGVSHSKCDTVTHNMSQKQKEGLKDSSEKSREVNHSGSSTIAPSETLMKLFKRGMSH